jgi:hypothetical protein
MQHLAYTEGRAVRMLTAMLAATDPAGRVEAGARPDSYEPTAIQVLSLLRDGAREIDLTDALTVQVPEAAQDLAARFAVESFTAAAVDWWVSTERMLTLQVSC